jgi:hypothetical protein
MTGHDGGVITLDLSESDDAHREFVRQQLGEAYRTVLGHLRHEIGHYYWPRLVVDTDQVAAFRELFGDESISYQDALDQHYGDSSSDEGTASWVDRYVSEYATMHPWEDWAETFAHYLHILDATDTAIAHELIPPYSTGDGFTDDVADLDFDDILGAWRPTNAAVNAIAETLGTPAVYPFEPIGAVVDKLAFVHRQVSAHTERHRFYATH